MSRALGVEASERLDRPFETRAGEGDPAVELRRIDGTSVAVEMSVDTDDEVPAWRVTLRDVAERHRSEEHVRFDEQFDPVVGRLTGGIAHDFNNLLAVILAATCELPTRSDRDTEELSGTIAGAAERGVDLVSRLLVVAGRQILEPHQLDVHHLVRSMLPALRRTLGDTIDVELGNACTSPWVLIDRNGLEHAILHLCLNGRDAMRSAGRLEIAIARHVEPVQASGEPGRPVPGEYIALSVTDHGKGISAEDLQRVREPYFTTKPPGVGTGLGLSMVHGFVRQSGGYLEIDSEIGRGTTVTMHLPAIPAPGVGADAAAAASGDGERESTAADDAAVARPLRILVVDDDELLRHLVTLQVERLVHHAIGVATIDEARRVLAEQHVDLLLTDVRLGSDEDGVDLASQALEERPDLPVVLMSGLVNDIRLPDGAQVPVLGKPFTRSQLRDAIVQALGR